MLLAYVDESYTDERYWIAAVICDQDVAARLSEALDGVVKRAAKAYGTSNTAELHGHALFRGKEDWSSIFTKVLVIADQVDGARNEPRVASHLVTVSRWSGHSPHDQLLGAGAQSAASPQFVGKAREPSGTCGQCYAWSQRTSMVSSQAPTLSREFLFKS